MIAALEAGFFRREIADAAFAYQREVDAKRKLIVGVNAFQESRGKTDRNAGHRRDGRERTGRRACSRSRRSATASGAQMLDQIRRVAATKENLMPALVEAATGALHGRRDHECAGGCVWPLRWRGAVVKAVHQGETIWRQSVMEALLTAEEYRRLTRRWKVPNGTDTRESVPMNLPTPRHGEICQTDLLIYAVGYLDDPSTWGVLVSNDSGIITEHDPDTVRAGHVAFYSYSRVPSGPMPQGYLSVVPELVFEVRSPGDRWGRILAKVGRISWKPV